MCNDDYDDDDDSNNDGDDDNDDHHILSCSSPAHILTEQEVQCNKKWDLSIRPPSPPRVTHFLH